MPAEVHAAAAGPAQGADPNARPRGLEEILERRGAEPTERLREVSFLGPEENPGWLEWTSCRCFPGEIATDPKGVSFQMAKE